MQVIGGVKEHSSKSTNKPKRHELSRQLVHWEKCIKLKKGNPHAGGQQVAAAVLHVVLSTPHVILQVSKGHFWLNHPELR